MKPRYERKYRVSPRTAALLKERVKAVMTPDTHSNGIYYVHNIYFDDLYDSFYYDKMRGSYTRDKYRLRWYNGDLSFMRLERKHKEGELSEKESVRVSEDQYNILRAGRIEEIEASGGVWDVFLNIHRLRRLCPKAAFSYRREAYCHIAGDVRVTFDTEIGGVSSGVGGIVELKYTSFLPGFISGLFGGLPAAHTENSKYCMVRDSRAGRG